MLEIYQLPLDPTMQCKTLVEEVYCPTPVEWKVEDENYQTFLCGKHMDMFLHQFITVGVEQMDDSLKRAMEDQG